MKKLLLAILLIAPSANAAKYWEVVPSTSTAMATATLSGVMNLYTSTTAATAAITLNGLLGSITATGGAVFDTNTLVVDAVNNRVGILTASPSYPLDIVAGGIVARMGPASAKVFIAANNGLGGVIGMLDNYPLDFKINNTDAMRLDTNRNLYIGATSGTNRLEVTGNIKINTAGNGLIFPDGTKQTSAAASTLDTANLTTRQTVLSGSIDASGYADFVAAGTGLNAEIQANASEPITFAFANGFGAYGGADYIQQITSTITVSVPASSTTYLYVTRDISMSVTGHYTAEIPVYGYSHPTCVNNKFSFLIPKMQMYVCSGGVWTSTAAVFVGQVTTDASLVTSAITYALRGEYKKQDSMTGSAATATSFSHNTGLVPDHIKAYAICVSAEHGYTAGEITEVLAVGTGGASTGSAASAGPLVGTIMSGSNGSPTTFAIISKTTGGLVSPTAANWNVIFSAKRGW
jgi:hypothetical protein